MSKKYIIANWKMNPSEPSEARKLLQNILQNINQESFDGLEVVICPPSPWLALFNKINKDFPFPFGGQAGFYKDKGAYTGRVSILMLKNLNISYLLVGHSETRRHRNLSSQQLKKTLVTANNKDITPIYFVGEKEKKSRKETLRKQLKPLSEWGKKERDFLLVYEPLWAISKKEYSRPARPEEVQKALQFIKSNLKKNKVSLPPFLYGGSTDDTNIDQFLSLDLVSGVVPGSASLKPKIFARMIKIASNH